MSLRRIAAFLVVTVAWTAPAWAQGGLYWETSNTGGSGGAQTARFWAVQKKMKIAGDDGHVVIVRTDQDKIISIDEKKKTYWEMPFSQLEALSKDMQAQMDTALSQMKDKLKDMPPEQRAMVEKMMGKMKGGEGGKEPQVEVKKTDESKSIIGYSCIKYVASEDGKPLLTAWTTMGVKEFAPLRADFVALQKRLNETNRAFRSGMAEAYAKIDGFPMETQMGEVTSTVTKVEPRTIPAGDFDPPAGFTKEAPPMPKKP